MTWKTERWLTDVFPGEENIYSEYRDLPPRELVIVIVAVLDCALAEILTLRLRKNKKEVESFLGLDGDGRAPVASFGARIQLGLLLDVLSSQDAAILRTIKAIRNEFAHRVNAGFSSPSILNRTTKLIRLWTELSEHLSEASAWSGSRESLDVLKQRLPHDAEAGAGLLLAIFCVYQAYFHRVHSRVKRVGRAVDISNRPGSREC